MADIEVEESNRQKKPKLNEKKLKRMESKKRKVTAFLEVALANEKDREAKKRKRTDTSDNTGDGVTNETDDHKVKEKALKTDEAGKNPILTDDEKMDLTAGEILGKELRSQRRKAAWFLKKSACMEKPKFFLTLDRLNVTIPNEEKSEPRPLFMLDVQQLLLLAIQGNKASFKPRWCKFLRYGKLAKTVVITVENVCAADYKNYVNHLSHLFNTFEESVEISPPCRFGSTVDSDLLTVPVSNSKLVNEKGVSRKTLKKKEETFQSTANSAEKKEIGPSKQKSTDNKEIRPSKKLKVMKTVEWTKEEMEVKAVHPFLERLAKLPPCPEEDFNRLSLLLSPAQLVEEKFPMPGTGRECGFSYTKQHYDAVTANSPLFAIDCEMCMTIGNRRALTWVSVVNEKMECVYQSYVKPYLKIIDYVTQYSGITEEILAPVQTRLPEIQREIQRILPSDAILVGQSLGGDLRALNFYHPYCIDTSVIYNLTGDRLLKTSLKRLMARFVGEHIQSGYGHDPTEDAAAALKLVLLKLRKGRHFGDIIFGGYKAVRDPPLFSKEGEHYEEEETPEAKSKPPSKPLEAAGDPGEIPNQEVKQKIVLDEAELARRKVFFQRNLGYTDDLFQLLVNNNKSACRIDRAENLRQSHQSACMSAVSVECKNDKEVCKRAMETVQEKDFMYATFSSYDPCDDEEKRKARLKKLDKRINKIYKSTPEKSLICVIFSGRNCDDDDDESTNAMAFFQIT